VGGPDELYEFEESASDNPTFYAELADPQSLNKYQYSYNNPAAVASASHQHPMARRALELRIAKIASGLPPSFYDPWQAL